MDGNSHWNSNGIITSSVFWRCQRTEKKEKKVTDDLRNTAAEKIPLNFQKCYIFSLVL